MWIDSSSLESSGCRQPVHGREGLRGCCRREQIHPLIRGTQSSPIDLVHLTRATRPEQLSLTAGQRQECASACKGKPTEAPPCSCPHELVNSRLTNDGTSNV